MRLEVLVLQCIRCVDTTTVKACAYQYQRLIQVRSQFALVSSLPVPSEIKRFRHGENFALFAAPAPLLEFIGRETRATKELLHLVAYQFRFAIEDAQELTRDWLGIDRWRILHAAGVFVDQLVDARPVHHGR